MKTKSRRTILNHSKFLTVEEHAVELPDGTVIPDWSWVITPDFINVVVITESEKFLCLRQTKYAIGDISLAVVGGYIEEGEEPILAGKRELLEETGYEASNWVDLGHYVVDANRGSGNAYAFLATGARKIAEPNADDLEEQELLLLSQKEIEAALFNGEFKVLPWANALALALLYLNRQNQIKSRP